MAIFSTTTATLRIHPCIQLIAASPVSYHLACVFLTLKSSQKPSQTSFAPHAISTLSYTSLNTFIVDTQPSISSMSCVTNFSQNFLLLNPLGTDPIVNVKLPSRAINEVTMRPFPQNSVGAVNRFGVELSRYPFLHEEGRAFRTGERSCWDRLIVI